MNWPVIVSFVLAAVLMAAVLALPLAFERADVRCLAGSVESMFTGCR